MADDDIAPEQCSAARAYLGWGRLELADRAGITDATVLNFELRRVRTKMETRQKIRRTFADAGLTFEDLCLLLPWTREAGP